MSLPRTEKGALESRWYAFNFSMYPEIRDYNESIVSVVVVSIDGPDSALISIGATPLDKDGNGKNERAAVKLTGGTAGSLYTVTITATTDVGNILEGRGFLDVVP